MSRTLADVRRRFDELLAQETAAPVQVDTVCDDGATIMFYLHLSDDNALAVSLDVPPGAGPAFVERCAAAASRWHWLH